MAFPNKPAGLSPVEFLSGATWNGQGHLYAIPEADTAGYWVGDVVMPGTSAGGTFGAGGDSQGIQYVTKYTEASADPVLGVIVAIGTDPTGSQYIQPNNLALNYRPAAAQSQVFYALVVDDPNVIYEVQEGGTGTNLTSAVIGYYCDLLVAAPATVGVVAVSGTQLDNTSTSDSTTTLPVKLLGLVQRSDNGFTTSPSTGGGGQKWRVILNNHFYRSATPAV